MAEPPEKKEKVCHSCGLDDQGQSTLLDADGARAAFLLAPDLVKACLTPETSCYECVASCGVAAESCRPVRVARSSG